jgi:MFS family permease
MARLSNAHNTRNILILGTVGYASSYFFELMFPTLAVALAGATRLPLEEALSWSFGSYLLFGLGALPAGFLADRMGHRRLLVVALFALGVAALAASEAPNGQVLIRSLALMGACASVFRPVSLSLIARARDVRPRGLRTVRAVGGAVLVLTPLVTAALCARLGWQATYRAVGYAMCAIAIASAFLAIDEARAEADGIVDCDADAPMSRDGGARQSLLPLAVLVGAAALAGVSYRGNMLVQPAYFAASVPALGFGVVTSLVYLFGVVAQFAAGWLAQNGDARRHYLLLHLCSVPALWLMTLLAGVPLVVCAALFAVCSFGVQPIEDRLFMDLVPAQWRATAYGVRSALTMSVGAFAVWLVHGALAIGGLSEALLWLAGVGALIAAAAALLVRLDERSPSRARLGAVSEAAGGPRAAGAVPAPVAALAINAAPPARRPPGTSGR